MSDQILGDRGKALEEMFFARESENLRKNLQEKEEVRDKKEALSSSSGITDDAVLEQLVALDIRSDTLAALSLVPLVEVAWADGTIDDSERSAIMSAAEDSGINDESAALLDGWLVTQPGSEVLSAWKDYVSTLTSKMDTAARDKLEQELLGRARMVAESAGGFLGIGSISPEEKDKLEELGRAFS
jgi:tellurite resistance protein